jgi:hypothetical protein
VANRLLTDQLSVPLEGTTMAEVDVDTGTGHLSVDPLSGGELMLAAGTLQYFEKQGVPSRSVASDHGRTRLALTASDTGRPWFRIPWAPCLGGTAWQICLNPTVPTNITAHTGGGNVRLNLVGLKVSRVAADSDGGNMEVLLPDGDARPCLDARTGGGNVTVDLGRGSTGSGTVDAQSGAGNVVVHVPRGLAARVHATSGWGKVTVESAFVKTAPNTYQSPGYDGATDRVEITARTGAGNVTIDTK